MWTLYDISLCKVKSFQSIAKQVYWDFLLFFQKVNIHYFVKTERKNRLIFDKTERKNRLVSAKTERNEAEAISYLRFGWRFLFIQIHSPSDSGRMLNVNEMQE